MKTEDNHIIRQILEVFSKHNSFILFNHVNPDADAVGAQLALYHALILMGKKVFMFSSEKLYPEYRFLPGSEKISSEFPVNKYEIAVFLDCAGIERAGIKIKPDDYQEMINIDHHVSNNNFGTINWVSAGSSSAGEMVCELLQQGGIKITAHIATCLYTSMFTDTGGFRHSNTSAKTLRLASEMVKAGADPRDIAKRIHGSFPERRFHLLGKSLGTLRTIADGKGAYMWVKQDFYNEAGANVTDADEFVEYPRSIAGVEIAFLFKETSANASARVNFRSNTPEHDVNKIASFFGGGGHREASACNIEGTREEIERKAVTAVLKELKAPAEK